MMLTDLDVAARASGLRVVEVAGWKTRGRPGGMAPAAPTGIVVHHTATSAAATGNYPTMNVILAGHGKLGGPLAQLGLGRDGTVYVCAAGRCNHAGAVDRPGWSNSRAIGIEAEHPGTGGWPDVQYRAYVALCAALAEHYQLTTDSVRGHKEVAVPRGRKNDPNFAMTAFRREVHAARRIGPARTVAVPPRDPRYGHRGIPQPLAEDGVLGGRTVDALTWYVPGGDRLVGLTRDNVRDVQTWLGRERTGRLDDGDVRALQAKTGSPVDGDWPMTRRSRTTLGLQRFLNRRIADAQKGT